MRRGTGRFRVIVAGAQCSAVSQKLQCLEPTLEIYESKDNGKPDIGLKSFSGGNFDSVILSQPYHVLKDVSFFSSAKDVLHPEEGTLGLLWARALSSDGWSSAYSKAILGDTFLGATRTGVPALSEGETPLTWMDNIGVSQHGFEAPKHRKFVEKLEGPPEPFFPMMPYIHDARLSLLDVSEAQKLGEAAAKRIANGALLVDCHSFHCELTAGVVKRRKEKEKTQTHVNK